VTSSEVEIRPRGRPALERGGDSPEGAPNPRVRRRFARGGVIEGECPIFRWVEITSIWWLLTLTIRLRRARLEAPMQLLNQLPMVTNLAGARSA
jgi:hypothetical protein